MGKAAAAQAAERRSELRIELTGFGIMALTFFCLLSVYSQQRGGSVNMCGPVGGLLASTLIDYFGILSTYTLLTLLSLAGAFILFRQSIPHWRTKVFSIGFLLIPAISVFEWCVTAEPLVGTELRGGYLGEYFGGVLDLSFQKWGTRIVLGLVFLVGFLLSTDVLVSPLLRSALGRGGRWIFRWGRQMGGQIGGQIGQQLRNAAGFVIPRPGRKTRRRPPSRAEDEEDDEEDEDDEEEDDDEYVYEDEEEEEDDDEPEEILDEDEEYDEDDEDEDEEYDDEEEDEEEEDEDEEDDEPDVVAKKNAKKSTKKSAKKSTKKSAGKKSPPPPRNIQISHQPTLAEATAALDMEKTQLSLDGVYSLPPISFLGDPPPPCQDAGKEELETVARKIEQTLASFKIEARVGNVLRGPVITQYEVSLAAGIKVLKIVSLSDDLAMALSARSVRVVAPIPGKAAVGIEVPNRKRETVSIKELLVSRAYQKKDFHIPMFLGKDAAGAPILEDLTRMPHLLIAGATGSGKSVCINSIIASMLMTRSPEELKLILVDPKMVELQSFENIPHLLCPVVTDMKKAPAALEWLCRKMDERYRLLSKAEVRNVASYNALGKKTLFERLTRKMSHEDADQAPEKIPYIVIVIDELADLMMTASKEVETSIIRLSQKSRAVGIHVILATQRPSVDVITGLIKANLPCRIAFQVAGRVDSRTIIDRNGAEKLLGEGDMLFLPPGRSQVLRAQGTYISDAELNKIVGFLKKESTPQFSAEIQQYLDGGGDPDTSEADDDLFEDAVRVILESGRGSASLLQRRLGIGYTRASRLMDIMGDRGLVGPYKGSKAREVFLSLEEWEAQKQG